MTTCIVFVCDEHYLERFSYTYHLLRTKGEYHGDVCLVVSDTFYGHPKLITLQHVEKQRQTHSPGELFIQPFPFPSFPPSFYQSQTALNRPKHWNLKLFQFHKLHLFQPFFKRWEYILYLDCGITIFLPIQPMLDSKTPNTMLAHSNAYPYYRYTLGHEFDKQTSLYDVLSSKYFLEMDYPQTTILLYDTEIIRGESTYRELYDLCVRYPISMTNDQGIIALYFTVVRPCRKQMPIGNTEYCFYDYLRRMNETRPYIMLKVIHIVDNNEKIEVI
jgi:hypothetical protein